MRVLYVDQTGKLGGGEIAILPWIVHTKETASVVLFEDGPFRNALEEQGVPVQVLTLGTLQGVRRESGAVAAFATIPAFLKLRRRLAARASGFDVLYANSQKAFLLAALARRRGQPLVWHLRDILTAEHFSPWLRRIAIVCGNRFATIVITNSEATAASFIAAGGSREKIRVVHDGVSAASFDLPTCPAVQALRQQIAPPARCLVGLFSRFSHWKGQHILLEAASTLPQVHVVLVGEALFGEDAYAARLRERAAQPDLAGRVSFLGFRRDIPELMRAMDIVAHTSTSAEPFGLVIVEGMLAKKPVIATRAGGAMEILAHGKSGILVEPGSVDQLRRAIEEILANPSSAANLSATGRRRAEELFSLDRLFHRLEGVMKELSASVLTPPRV